MAPASVQNVSPRKSSWRAGPAVFNDIGKPARLKTQTKTIDMRRQSARELPRIALSSRYMAAAAGYLLADGSGSAC